MKLEKEYRLIYGAWQYIEKIFNELGATYEIIEKSGSEDSKLVLIYEAKLSNTMIRAEVIYEKKPIPPFPKYITKASITNIQIEVNSSDQVKEKEIFVLISDRLKLYTMRAGG